MADGDGDKAFDSWLVEKLDALGLDAEVSVSTVVCSSLTESRCGRWCVPISAAEVAILLAYEPSALALSARV